MSSLPDTLLFLLHAAKPSSRHKIIQTQIAFLKYFIISPYLNCIYFSDRIISTVHVSPYDNGFYYVLLLRLENKYNMLVISFEAYHHLFNLPECRTSAAFRRGPYISYTGRTFSVRRTCSHSFPYRTHLCSLTSRRTCLSLA